LHIYFPADFRMYNRLLCNSFRCMWACVGVCDTFYAS